MKDSKSDSRHHKLSAKLEALSDTLHKLNHDVRSPINGIIGLTNLMIKDKDRVQVRTKELAMIKESAESIIDIIDEVLMEKELSKKTDTFSDYREIAFIINQIKRLYMPAAYEKGINLSLDCQVDGSERIPYKLATKILKIISNLVSNAIKFTPTHGTVTLIVNSNHDEKEKMLHISVRDNGIGMSSDQTKAFNEGMAIESSVGTMGEESFGVGLNHIKKMVTEECGAISVSSVEKKGTNFSVFIPIRSQSNCSSSIVNV